MLWRSVFVLANLSMTPVSAVPLANLARVQALLPTTALSLPPMSAFLGGLLESPLGCCAYLFKAFSRYSWIHFNFGSMHTCLLLFFSLALPKHKGRDTIQLSGRKGSPGLARHTQLKVLTEAPSCCSWKPQFWKT